VPVHGIVTYWDEEDNCPLFDYEAEVGDWSWLIDCAARVDYMNVADVLAALWLIDNAENFDYALVLSLPGDDDDDAAPVNALLAKRLGGSTFGNVYLFARVEYDSSAADPVFNVYFDKDVEANLVSMYEKFARRVLREYEELCAEDCSKAKRAALEKDRAVAEKFINALRSGESCECREVVG